MKFYIDKKFIIETILIFVVTLLLISKVFKEPMDRGRMIVLFILAFMENILYNLVDNNEYIKNNAFLKTSITFFIGASTYLLYVFIVSRLFLGIK